MACKDIQILSHHWAYDSYCCICTWRWTKRICIVYDLALKIYYLQYMNVAVIIVIHTKLCLYYHHCPMSIPINRYNPYIKSSKHFQLFRNMVAINYY